MRPTSVAPLLLATLVGVGAAFWLDAKEPRKPWPKATPPPPPSPIYFQSKEVAPGEAEIVAMAREHNQRLEDAIGRALMGRDAGQREAAFTFLLPELVQVDPHRLVAMVESLEPGEARDTLRTELTRQWIARDPEAAIKWMETLPEEERRASARVAVDSIAAHSPVEAAAIAREFATKSGSRAAGD